MDFSLDDNVYDNCEPADEHGFGVSSGSQAREDRYCKYLPAGQFATSQLHEAGARDLIQAVSTKTQYQTNRKDDAQSSNKRLLTTLAVLSLLISLLSVAATVYVAFMARQSSHAVSEIADFQKNVLTDISDRQRQPKTHIDAIFSALQGTNLSNPELSSYRDIEMLAESLGIHKNAINRFYRSLVVEVLSMLDDRLCALTPPNELVRLVNGENATNCGRVEIQYEGNWGTICDDEWDIRDANVICRMLGFRNATSAPCCAQYGSGTGSIMLDDVHCGLADVSICHCSKTRWRQNDCDHGEDASVVCAP